MAKVIVATLLLSVLRANVNCSHCLGLGLSVQKRPETAKVTVATLLLSVLAAGQCQLFALFGTWLVCAVKACARNGKGHSRNAFVKCAGCGPMSTVHTFWDLPCLCRKVMCQKWQRS